MSKLLELIARVEALKGPDRDLDAEIAEYAYGWKPAPCPPDANGENAGEVLTPDGQPFKVNGDDFRYPPLGRIHRGFHVPEYTRNCRDPAFPCDAVRQQTIEALKARASTEGTDK